MSFNRAHYSTPSLMFELKNNFNSIKFYIIIIHINLLRESNL